MRVYDIIKKKRDGFELSTEEICFIVNGATSGSIPDYQLTAFLMAVYFKGMSSRETLDFTLAIASSGDKVTAKINGIKADKHSTGGVGDKTSLIIAPTVASLGLKVLKMSGRGLGHTGGTVDKLESIKGFNVSLDYSEFLRLGETNGVVIIGQTKNLAPADKVFYSLRDVTATVDSIPLISASIMGKKLTADDDVIVLDVKTGEGAFMKTLESAKELAKTMVEIGKGAGKKISAVITDMNEPLGYAVGNALEVKEVINVLKGEKVSDLLEVSLELGAEMLYLSGYGDKNYCKSQFLKAIENGSAYSKFKEFVSAQGGSLQDFENGNYLAEYSLEVKAQQSGYISGLNAELIGRCALSLGAGREKVSDKIDYKAGVVLTKKVGDSALKGETLATLYTSNKELFKNAETLFNSSVTISLKKVRKASCIIDVI
ncbi:MAG: thymidine phosphorylase [Clostridia bacterium]|nr:thymidine phosphorylase [Clostridia bacterium]